MVSSQAIYYDFKFQLRKSNPGARDEFYRACVEESVARDWVQLNKKILGVMPKIRKRSYVLTWTNAEEDEVVVDDDEALENAINEMTERRIYK